MPANPETSLAELLSATRSLLALAPMQDVTTLEFLRVTANYGGPDIYWTEYFRIHGDSRPEKWILRSITENPTGRPIIAQMIGNDIPALVRNAKILQELPVAAIDLNLGCPAPVVYRKCAGGGLLREPERINSILGALRDAITIPFTVKTRIGFETAEEFDRLLPIFSKHSLDLLTVHGRTVLQMYRPGVRYDLIAQAAAVMRCPVFANGDVRSAAHAAEVVQRTGVRGLMIGRGAIRNPWIFEQFRQQQRGEPERRPNGSEVLDYIRALWEAELNPAVPEPALVQRMKKFMNFIGEGVGLEFLHAIRRAQSTASFFQVCEEFLDHDDPLSLEPRMAASAVATNR